MKLFVAVSYALSLKARVFVPGKPLQPCLMARSQVKHLKGALELKGLPGTKAIAYYENVLLTAIKGFITLAPEQYNFQYFRMLHQMEYVLYSKFRCRLAKSDEWCHRQKCTRCCREQNPFRHCRFFLSGCQS